MSTTCYNCGTENAGTEKNCRKCGADLGSPAKLQDSGIQAGPPAEHTLWDNGDITLTTEAVLIGMNTDAPDVIPLETIRDVVLEERCIVLKLKTGDDKFCMLRNPSELADLVREQVFRPRFAQERRDMGRVPSE